MQGLTNEEISNETGYTYNQVCRVIYKEMDMERKNKSWTLFDIQEIKKLYKDGNSLEEIADIFGKSRATVSYVLSYNGIKARDLRKDGDV